MIESEFFVRYLTHTNLMEESYEQKKEIIITFVIANEILKNRNALNHLILSEVVGDAGKAFLTDKIEEKAKSSNCFVSKPFREKEITSESIYRFKRCSKDFSKQIADRHENQSP